MKSRSIVSILVLGFSLACGAAAEDAPEAAILKPWQVEAIHRVEALLGRAGNESGVAALRAELAPVSPPAPEASWLNRRRAPTEVRAFEVGAPPPPRRAIAAAAGLLADLGYPAEALEFVGAFTSGDKTSGEQWWIDPRLFLESRQATLEVKAFRPQQFYSSPLTAALEGPQANRASFRSAVMASAWDVHRWAPRPQQLEVFYVHLLGLLDDSEEDRRVARTLQYLRAHALRRHGTEAAEVRVTLRRLYRHLLRDSREHPDPTDRSFYRMVRREWMDLLSTWGEVRALRSLAEDILDHTRRYRDYGAMAIRDRRVFASFLEPGPVKSRLLAEADRFR